MGCDSQFDGYYDGERQQRVLDEVEMRRKVRKVTRRTDDIGVDEFIAAVRAIIRNER